VAEISYLENVLGLSRNSALRLLKRLHINPIYSGREVFFSLPTFQRIMYVLTRPGGRGFILPGTQCPKDDPRLREVTDDILEEANDPMTLAVMSAIKTGDTLVLRKMMDVEKRKGRGQ